MKQVVLAAFILALGCKSDKGASDNSTKPSTEAACEEGSIVFDYNAASGSPVTHIELGCDKLPYFRGSITNRGKEQPLAVRITADDLDKVWKAVEAAGWKDLPGACGDDSDPTNSMEVRIKIRRGSEQVSFDCSGALMPAHAKLVDAIKLVSPENAFNDLAIAKPGEPKEDGEGRGCPEVCKLMIGCDGWTGEDGKKLEGDAALKSCTELCENAPEGTTFDTSIDCLTKAKTCDDIKACNT